MFLTTIASGIIIIEGTKPAKQLASLLRGFRILRNSKATAFLNVRGGLVYFAGESTRHQTFFALPHLWSRD